jgi:hypothetical protein
MIKYRESKKNRNLDEFRKNQRLDVVVEEEGEPTPSAGKEE